MTVLRDHTVWVRHPLVRHALPDSHVHLLTQDLTHTDVVQAVILLDLKIRVKFVQLESKCKINFSNSCVAEIFCC